MFEKFKVEEPLTKENFLIKAKNLTKTSICFGLDSETAIYNFPL